MLTIHGRRGAVGGVNDGGFRIACCDGYAHAAFIFSAFLIDGQLRSAARIVGDFLIPIAINVVAMVFVLEVGRLFSVNHKDNFFGHCGECAGVGPFKNFACAVGVHAHEFHTLSGP